MVSTKILRLLHFYTFCCCKKTTLFTATTLDSTNTIIQVLAVCASAIGRKCAGKRQKRSEGRGVLYGSNSWGSEALYGNNKKAPPGQTNYFKFLFSGAPLKDFKFFSRRLQSVQDFFQEAAEVSSVFLFFYSEM